MPVSEREVFGPYSRSPCFSELDTTCETNAGARYLRVLSLAHILFSDGDENFDAGEALSNMTFASGRIIYTALPTPKTLPLWIIAAIALASAAAVAAVGGLLLFFRLSARNNSNAPKDQTKPFTIIFTDIQSSTKLWALAPVTMANALEVHHELIRSLIAKHRCYEVKTIGDAFMISCQTAEQAIRLSYDLQFAMMNYEWGTRELDDAYLAFEQEAPEAGEHATEQAEVAASAFYQSCWNGLRLRIGFHTGIGEIKLDEVTKGYDYYGSITNMAAQTESAAHGGQVLLTDDARKELLYAAPHVLQDYKLLSVGKTTLRGFSEETELFQLTTVPNRVFPALESAVQSGAAGDDEAPGGHSKSSDSGSLACSPNGSEYDVMELLGPRTGNYLHSSKWSRLALVVMETMLSVLSEPIRKSILDRLHDRWRTKQAAGAGEGLEKLAEKIGFIIKQKEKSSHHIEGGEGGGNRQLEGTH